MTGGDPQTPDLAAVGQIHRKAIAQIVAGRPAASIVLVRRALAKLNASVADEPPGEPANQERQQMMARILTSLAKCEVEIVGIQVALETMARATRWAEAAGDTSLMGIVHGQLGLLLFRGGRFADSLAELDAALSMTLDSTGVDKCRLLINRGALFVEMGNIAAARTDLTRCQDLAERFSLSVVQRIATHNLGCLEFQAGNLPLALRTMDEGFRLDPDTQAGIAFLDRARVLLAAGLLSEAQTDLTKAASQFRRERCWQDLGEVELTLAEVALLRGQAAESRRLAGRARNRFRRHGNDRWRRNAELVLLQADLRDNRPAARLIAPTHRLADELAEDGFALQSRIALLLAAELEHALGHLDQAAERAAQAGDPQRFDPIQVRLHTRYVRALLSVARGDRPTARRQLRLGITELVSYQAQFGGVDLQTASAIHGVRLAELDVKLAMAHPTPAAVFAAFERSRAASQRLRTVVPPPDDATAQTLSELRRTVEALRGRSAEPAAASERIGLQRKAAALQAELRSRAWQAPGIADYGRLANLVRFRTSLAIDDSDGVYYAEWDGHVLAVSLRERRPRVHDCGSASRVDELVRRARSDLGVLADPRVPPTIADAAYRSLTRSLTDLDTTLIAPLKLRRERVVLIPLGSLLALPWGSLPSLRHRPVVVAPSATSFVRAATSFARASTGRTVPARSQVAVLAGPGLHRAEEEAHAVAAAWPDASVFTGPAAEPARLLDALSQANVVHLAAHGHHQAENPMFSSVRLTQGPVFAYELDQRVTAAEHVVLSACEVGLVTVRAGGESLGLTSVLLHLGTRSVIAGVARVGDDVAAQVMKRYHAALASGDDSALALAQACASVGPVPAPFVCFGSTWSAHWR